MQWFLLLLTQNLMIASYDCYTLKQITFKNFENNNEFSGPKNPLEQQIKKMECIEAAICCFEIFVFHTLKLTLTNNFNQNKHNYLSIKAPYVKIRAIENILRNFHYRDNA